MKNCYMCGKEMPYAWGNQKYCGKYCAQAMVRHKQKERMSKLKEENLEEYNKTMAIIGRVRNAKKARAREDAQKREWMYKGYIFQPSS
jgi:hypothetical protein